jgi:saccharopine dehydrogenase-like NADP-dependent oxidoreductase
MTEVLVLGAGRVGSAVARDLARDPSFTVAAADLCDRALAKLAADGIATHLVDLTDPDALHALVRGFDLVVGAVPGPIGFGVLRQLLESGRDVVDISFFPEDPFTLDELARSRGVRAVVDAGVAPGLSNLVLGYLDAVMEGASESFSCQVGGLPVRRDSAWEYRALFSPTDVIAEYVRPARLRRGGQDLILPALDEVETVHVGGVGPLEAFLTDGLRTLLRSLDTPSMVEKTLRYPGHAAKARALRDSGFFGTTPVILNGVSVRPLDLTSRLLEEAWKLRDGEADLTLMRMEVVGLEGGERVRHVIELVDRYDRASGVSSMARTTGYTCTAIVRWLARGGWQRSGILPPELLGRDPACFDFVVACLEERGIHLQRSREPAAPEPTP